jgi:hypothetical protein
LTGRNDKSRLKKKLNSMFTEIIYLHVGPIRNGTKEIIGIFLGANLQRIRVYPSILLKKDHKLSLDSSQLYDIQKPQTGLLENNCHIATFDPSLPGGLIVFNKPKKMLRLRKERFFEKWEEFCGSIVRRYYLRFPRGLFNEIR